MIVDLPSTTTEAVSKKLVRLRQDVGAMALGRVLTLVIVVDEHEAEEALDAANDASRQHPSRIVCLVTGNTRGTSRLDAQIRVGGDAGASEIVVLRLYGALSNHGQSVVVPLLLPDSPVVVWWPTAAPADVSADPIGAMAQRRITDSAEAKNPRTALQGRARTYAGGDSDLAWTRITRWRGLLAAALDQAPYEQVTSATVTGASDSPSTDLLAAWLAQSLRCPVIRARTQPGQGMVSVRLERRGGTVDLVRPDGTTATLSQPAQPDRRISLPRRGLAECLADELRRLDPDEVYSETIRLGLPKISTRRGVTASEAESEGLSPSVAEARRTARRIRREGSGAGSNQMVEAPAPPAAPSTAVVKKAAARKLAEPSADPALRAGTGEKVRPTGKSAGRTRTEKTPEKAPTTRTERKQTKRRKS